MNIIALAEARKRLMEAQRRTLPEFGETWPQMKERHQRERRRLASIAILATPTIVAAAESLDMSKTSLHSFVRRNRLRKSELMKEIAE